MAQFNNSRGDDEVSMTGALFETGVEGVTGVGGGAPRSEASRSGGVSTAGLTRAAAVAPSGYGRGRVPADPRKFKYDRARAATMATIDFGASKADRLDAAEAGAVLDRIHVSFGIGNDPENVLSAFDKALFFEHTINGASLLQPGRGNLVVGTSTFDISMVKSILSTDQRRFFRAFADDITDVNKEVIDSYDPYDVVSAEKYGQLMQAAILRGLQKFPYLAHDSSDAGVRLTVEERMALMKSKRIVLDSVVNAVDEMPVRTGTGKSIE